MTNQAEKNRAQVSFRLPMQLLKRLRQVTRGRRQWPPSGPSQTDLIARGIELALLELEEQRHEARRNR
jgi:hypothetical protein